MTTAGCASVALCLVLCGGAAIAAPLTVTVDNRSRSTTCAEEDNVSVALTAPGVTRFTVEALPPAYLAALGQDHTAPDFTGCNFDGAAHPTDPRYHFTPGTRVLHDGPQWRIVGLTLATFWRSQRVPVTVDGVTTRGLHLLQIFRKTDGSAHEVVVLYPSDGYWRIKPLPEVRFGDGLYGSSLLLGPIVAGVRPVVAIRSVAITTRPLGLRLRFANGSTARVTIEETSRRRTALGVWLRPASDPKRPFAMLRSMYVAEDNADVSEVAWRPAPDAAMQTLPLPDLSSLRTTEVRLGRGTVSRHNSSAPDLRFSAFR